VTIRRVHQKLVQHARDGCKSVNATALLSNLRSPLSLLAPYLRAPDPADRVRYLARSSPPLGRASFWGRLFGSGRPVQGINDDKGQHEQTNQVEERHSGHQLLATKKVAVRSWGTDGLMVIRQGEAPGAVARAKLVNAEIEEVPCRAKPT
jgi:hypothetical protein